MKLTSQDIYETLKTVKDPELGIDIVALGLTYKVTVEGQDKETRIKILMTLTTPGCPLGTTIVRLIRDSLARYPFINPERDVEVEIVFDPPWTQDLMSDEAKAELGF